MGKRQHLMRERKWWSFVPPPLEIYGGVHPWRLLGDGEGATVVGFLNALIAEEGL
jgi:hypothetical protein